MPELSRAAAARLLASWDRQQASYGARRDERFEVMFDVLEARCGRRPNVLDLGSGPGSLSARLLGRFPRARSWAVDLDPVTLAIGRRALAGLSPRLTWVEGDLAGDGWTRALGHQRFEAALSTTALHWLPEPALRRLYRTVFRRLRPGGVLLNGDYLPWPARARELRTLADRVRTLRTRRAGGGNPFEPWATWWREARRVRGLATAFAEHDRRFPSGHPFHRHIGLAEHEAALRAAGFRRVGVVWQDLESRVLVAFR